jgi:hypothetical protein
VSVSGLDATQIQGVPVSGTPPTADQGLFYNATTGEWTPTSITTATGDLITGDGTGLPTLLRVGSLGQVLEVGAGGVLQWKFVDNIQDLAGTSRPINGDPRAVNNVLTWAVDPDTGQFAWNSQPPASSSSLAATVTRLPADVAITGTQVALLALGPLLVGHMYWISFNATFLNGPTQEIVNAFVTDNVNPASNTGGSMTLQAGSFWGTISASNVFTIVAGSTTLILAAQTQVGGGGVTAKALTQANAGGATSFAVIQLN